jgi:molybdate transport system ATP-binding protein
MSLVLDIRHDAPLLDFSAELPSGAITALAGPSGSGKTSLLRAVAGLLRTRQARIVLDGDPWDAPGRHRPTRERPIGLVPQHYGLFPHLTVLGNVEAALLHLPRAERRAQALACLERTRINGLEGRLPRQLSGGQRQRVALARAIARGPRLLLLDEPFSAVDRATRKQLYVELRLLHAQTPLTMLLVTHDLDEAAQLASHLVLLDRGRLIQAGPTPEVLTRPNSEAAARLLDIPNLFDAVLETVEDRPRLRWGPHTLRLGAAPPGLADGPCRFAVLPENVLLVRPDRPGDRQLENPLPARVAELMELGPEVLVWLVPEGLADRVQMRLPERALRRYQLSPGSQIEVCLRGADILPLVSGAGG